MAAPEDPAGSVMSYDESGASLGRGGGRVGATGLAQSRTLVPDACRGGGDAGGEAAPPPPPTHPPLPLLVGGRAEDLAPHAILISRKYQAKEGAQVAQDLKLGRLLGAGVQVCAWGC